MVAGDIFLKYTEGDTINIKEAMPSITYNPDEYFEFTVEGKNTYKKDVVYEIILDEGDQPTGEGNESRTERIKPELLKFRLVEIKDGKEEELIQEGNYDSIQKKRIWVDRVKANTKENIKYTYRLYMWISSDAKIGNMEGADYTAEVWNNNVYASVKVGVNGDFNPKDLTEDYLILNATNESGEKYDLKQPVQSDEDVTITLGSKREITKFVVEKSDQNPISLTSLESPTDYPASYNEATRAWEAKVTIDETGIYDYYAEYSAGKNSKTYSFTVLMNPDRFVKVEKPTSALCKQGLTYTGSPQDLIDESNLDKEGYTITQVQGTDAKEYEVKAHLKEKFRWSDSSQEDATFNCTIGPKTTQLTYEPTSKLSVAKGSKGTVKITAPTEGTFEVTSKASGTASVTFTPASGTSTTVTVSGVEIGSTSLDVKFTSSNNNYTDISDTYSIEVTKPPIATSVLKEKLGTGGLIGVTTDNTMTTSKTASNIREYRYSGASVNNYVYFNCSDSKSEQNSNNCEIWRIIGIFKDDSGQEYMKIVRSSVSTSMIWNSSRDVHWWIYSNVNTYLNGSYLTSLTSKAQNMIEEMKWYLGAITLGSSGDNTKSAYTKERNGDTWTGKIAPMYASDYGFSASDSYWSTNMYNYDDGAMKTSWLYIIANCLDGEWFMSPYSGNNAKNVAFLSTRGSVSSYGVSNSSGVRPSLYLKSTVQIIDGEGTSDSPYQLSVQ